MLENNTEGQEADENGRRGLERETENGIRSHGVHLGKGVQIVVDSLQHRDRYDARDQWVDGHQESKTSDDEAGRPAERLEHQGPVEVAHDGCVTGCHHRPSEDGDVMGVQGKPD